MAPLRGRQRAPGGNGVPFGEAAAATTRRGVLSDENWMASHWRLPAVIVGRRGRETAVDEVGGVDEHALKTLSLQIGAIFRTQSEAGAKAGSGQRMEDRVWIAHGDP